MGLLLFYGVLLLILYTLPAVFTLWPVTYGVVPVAHFLVFLLSAILFAALGRGLGRRRRKRFTPAFLTGAVTAFAGTAIGQYLRHLPMAEEAFIRQLHGVPRAAALAMLNLHVVSGTLITGLMYAVLYGFVGGFAAWWGGRLAGSGPGTPPGCEETPDPADDHVAVRRNRTG
ncbi:MAG: hypothetical protein M0Z53_08585 [Thermaerobacter sp.]|nr:hypothetical protein [Thermaerobacter sp.]